MELSVSPHRRAGGEDLSSLVTRLTPYLALVRADNPGAMTLDGTNTWIVGDPSLGAPLVVDPGPQLPDHLDAILTVAGGRISSIVLTHRHLDHAESAPTLAERAFCPVRAADLTLRMGTEDLDAGDLDAGDLDAGGLDSGDQLELPGARVEIVSTPGHTSDSRSLLIVGGDDITRLLTGDMVLGRGTTVIMHPDGNLAEYLDSLTLMASIVEERNVVEILPGHGPVVENPAELLANYRAHRLERLAQVRAAIEAGDRTAEEVVARVYADVDRRSWPAATLSVQAQLSYLAAGPNTDTSEEKELR